MAFLASKYEGGIMVNDINRLAPLFSGGEQMKIEPYKPSDITAFQLKALQFHAKEADIQTQLQFIDAKLKSGNFTGEDIQNQKILNQELGELNAQKNHLLSESNALMKIINEDPRANKESVINNIVTGTAIEKLIYSLGIDTSDEQYALSSERLNNGQAQSSVADLDPLYTNNGQFNRTVFSPLFSGDGFDKTFDDWITGVSANFRQSSSSNNAANAIKSNQDFVTHEGIDYLTNMVSLYAAGDAKVNEIIKDPNNPLFLEAKADVLGQLRNGNLSNNSSGGVDLLLSGSKVYSIQGIQEEQYLTYLLKDNEGNLYYEAYKQGDPKPYYYSVNPNDYQISGYGYTGKPKNVEYVKTNDQWITESQKKLLALYIDIENYGDLPINDPNYLNALLGNAYDALTQINNNIKDPKNENEYIKPIIWTEELTEEEQASFKKYAQQVTYWTKEYGQIILDRLTENSIKQRMEERIQRKISTSIISNNEQKLMPTDIMTANAQVQTINDLFDNMNSENMNYNGLYNTTAGGLNGYNGAGEIKIRDVNPETYEFLTSPQLMTIFNKNNTRNPQRENSYFANFYGVDFEINPDNKITVGSNMSNTDMAIAVNWQGLNGMINIPLDKNKTSNVIIYRPSNQVALMPEIDGDHFKAEIDNGQKIGDKINSIKQLYTGYVAAMPVGEFLNQTVVVYKDEMNKMMDLSQVMLMPYSTTNKWSLYNPSGKASYVAYEALATKEQVYKILREKFEIYGQGDDRKLRAKPGVDSSYRDIIAIVQSDTSMDYFQQLLRTRQYGGVSEIEDKLAELISTMANNTIKEYQNTLGWKKNSDGKEFITTTMGELFPDTRDDEKIDKILARVADNGKKPYIEINKNGVASKNDYIDDIETTYIVFKLFAEVSLEETSLLTTKGKNAVISNLQKLNNQTTNNKPQTKPGF